MTTKVMKNNVVNHIESYLKDPSQNNSLLTFISIDGNIGVGKSTFLEKLLKGFSRPNIYFLPEPVNEWIAPNENHGRDSLLKLYYNDKENFAQLFQTIIMFSYNIKLLNILYNYIINQKGPVKVKWPLFIISERSMQSALDVFVQLLIEDNFIDEKFKIDYRKIYNQGPYPDIILYLRKSDIEKLLLRIQKRNREGEDGINVDFLKKHMKY